MQAKQNTTMLTSVQTFFFEIEIFDCVFKLLKDQKAFLVIKWKIDVKTWKTQTTKWCSKIFIGEKGLGVLKSGLFAIPWLWLTCLISERSEKSNWLGLASLKSKSCLTLK